jgi:radical SAM-linked protein
MTPFQWAPQLSPEEMRNRVESIKERLKRPGLRVKWNDPPISVLEAVFARGDRRLGKAIQRAWELGARFDGWSELFREDIWLRAFEETSIDPAFYAQRERPRDEILPWDHLSAGVEKEFLVKEYDRAISEEYTPDCRWDPCTRCGVCDHKTIRPHLHTETDAPRPSRASHASKAGQDLFLYRLRYSKVGVMRFFGQLETVQSFGRAIRRSGLPAAYSKGFHPHVKLSFTEALPLGLESLVEEAYLSLTEKLDPETVQSRLNSSLPLGLRIEEASAVARRDAPSPSRRITYAVSDLSPWMVQSVTQDWSHRLQEEMTKKTKKGEIRARLGEILLDVRRLDETSLEIDLLERPQVCFRPTVVLQHLLGEPPGEVSERFAGSRICKVKVSALAEWGEEEDVGRAHHQQ